ncbi:MAG: ArdC-like ssDNA-binding domain-containing protein [Micavibrio sp.]|nr:ArdC-like ssDNA-binding domain-containing protein [Micavibrio sp.]
MNDIKKDIYSRVTDRIIADLEKGVRTWLKPWAAANTEGKITLPLRHNGTPYQGVNILLLWGEAIEKGFNAPIWMTYKQAQELGANVRKGEKSALVVYANKLTRTETDEGGEEIEKKIPFMKGYAVFNVEQIDGLPTQYYSKPEKPLPLAERLNHAESFLTQTGAAIRHGGNRAFYSPLHDFVQMPPFEAFKDKESYYATVLHELTHWTSHKNRLDRSFNAKKFGDNGYARGRTSGRTRRSFFISQPWHYAGNP